MGEMTRDLQKLAAITEPEAPRTPLLPSPLLTNIASSPPTPDENRGARSYDNLEHLNSPTATPNRGSRSPTISDTHSRTSSGAFRFVKGMFSQTTSVVNQREACHTMISADGRSIMAWTSSMACCFHILIQQWTQIVLVNDILLAAAGPTYFATAFLTNGVRSVHLLKIYGADMHRA